MKNQFVGDINDYFKYALLRILSGFGKKQIGVCWMRTPDRTEYLTDPRKWRKFDPELFDKLRRIVKTRSVRRIEKAEILPGARFHKEPFTDRSRETYFDEALCNFADVDLVFFDPDVGLAPSASTRANKWLHYDELEKAFSRGHSVFVIQFPRREKADWVGRVVERIRKATQAADIYTFRTPTVVFFLAVQRRHVDFFCHRAKVVKKRWGSKVAVTPDPDGR